MHRVCRLATNGGRMIEYNIKLSARTNNSHHGNSLLNGRSQSHLPFQFSNVLAAPSIQLSLGNFLGDLIVGGPPVHAERKDQPTILQRWIYPFSGLQAGGLRHFHQSFQCRRPGFLSSATSLHAFFCPLSAGTIFPTN